MQRDTRGFWSVSIPTPAWVKSEWIRLNWKFIRFYFSSSFFFVFCRFMFKWIFMKQLSALLRRHDFLFLLLVSQVFFSPCRPRLNYAAISKSIFRKHKTLFKLADGGEKKRLNKHFSCFRFEKLFFFLLSIDIDIISVDSTWSSCHRFLIFVFEVSFQQIFLPDIYAAIS